MESAKPIAWVISSLNLPPSLAGPYIHIVMSVIALTIIVIVSTLVWRRLKTRKEELLPDDRATLINTFEVIITSILKMMEDVMGDKARRHFPFIGSVFVYILICNLMAVVPGLLPPTENINTNLGIAIVVFIYYNYAGIRENGLKEYIKHMAGPIIWIAPLILAIEIVSHIVRPLSLSVRLFGNIVGDHMVLGIFSDLVPFLIPMLFMMLGIFVAFIQAFVFTLLSIIYISLATEKEIG